MTENNANVPFQPGIALAKYVASIVHRGVVADGDEGLQRDSQAERCLESLEKRVQFKHATDDAELHVHSSV